MMDNVTRNRFLQQISHWAQDYIATGRSPFRKTEINANIITSGGAQSLDLLFWINQESFVAGGFILFPDDDQFDMEAALASSQALGIRYFATWTAQNITVWCVDDQSIHSQISPPKTTDTDRIDRFEDSLIQLMDEFRTLAVLGLCPPEKLSFWHLTNLCIGAHERALPLLSEHFRRNPELHAKHLPSFEVQAQEKLSLSMARLLSLLYLDKIPYNLQPENLDHALCYLASELEEQSFGDLKPSPNEPELDESSAVLFHHLLRRLDQISIFNNQSRAVQVLNQLLKHNSLCLDTASENEDSDYNMLLFCNMVPCATEQLIEVDQPARLALKYLLRKLMGCPTGQHHHTDLFQLQVSQQAELPQQRLNIKACLSDATTPNTQQRNAFSTHLRLVSPNQNFELHRSTPTWVYHLCYVLGIMSTRSQLSVQMPSSLLSSPFSDGVIKWMQTEFTLHSISSRSTQVIHMSLSKGTVDSTETVLNGEVKRRMAWSKLRKQAPEQLALTLLLPEGPYRLLQRNLVGFASDPASQSTAGIEHFKNSSLGQCFNYYLQPKVDRAKRSKWQPRTPLPSDAVLAALKDLDIENTAEQRPRIDQELGRLLDIEIASLNPTTGHTGAHASHRAAKEDKKMLATKIIQLIQVRGVPEFPTHYLYEFYLPELSQFPQPTTAWEISSEFMGTYQLSNNDDDIPDITVDNEFTAHAIVLASYNDSSINLPAARDICSTIVTRYLNDLDDIHTIIWRECHAAVHQNETANRLVRKLWKELNLPPWNTIEKYLKRFNISD